MAKTKHQTVITDDGQGVPNFGETQYRSIFESASTGMAIIGVNGEFLQANPAFCQLLGYSAKEMASLKLSDITHPLDRLKTESLYKDLINGRCKNISYEKRYVKKDGSIFWGHPVVATTYDENQAFFHFVAQIADLSEGQQAEKELVAAHQQLQDIIEFLPDAICVIDKEKKVTAWNRAMEEKTGVRKTDILGKGNYAYGEAMYRERGPILIDLIDCPDPEVESRYSYFEKKGETLFAERFLPTLNGGKGGYVWLKASPLYDPGGNLVGAIESIRDITDRKQAEHELRVAHQQMQDIIEFLPDATFVIDKEQKVVAWNRAMEAMSGIDKEKIIGQDNHAYSIPFYGERRPILIDLIGSPSLIEKAPYDYIEERGETKCIEQYLPTLRGGKGAYVWATATQLLDQSGNFAGAIESIRDITERKQTEEKLKQTNSELDAFVYTISHDLRSPLTAVIGYSQLLSSTYEDQLDREALECLEKIENQGERMVSLLEDLLSLAKVGYLARPTEPVDLDIIVDEISEEIVARHRDKKIIITREILPKIHVPKTLIFQVLNNLLCNAVQYACDNSSLIEVNGERSGNQVRFYVRDHGPGISKEERTNVFNLFSRGNSGKSREGTGIGLAIVQKIARLYNGNAWLEETPGGGCTFGVEMLDESPRILHATQ